MKIPILLDRPNEFTRYSVYDTDTYTVSIISYEELLSTFQEIIRDRIKYEETIRSFIETTFNNKVLQLTSDILYYSCGDSVCIYKGGKVYTYKYKSMYIPVLINGDIAVLDFEFQNFVYVFFECKESVCIYKGGKVYTYKYKSMYIPVLINGDIAVLDFEFQNFVYVFFECKENIGIGSLKRMLLLNPQRIYEFKYEANVSAIMSSPKSGIEFGNYERLELAKLEILSQTHEVVKSLGIDYILNCKQNGLKYSYLRVKDEIYAVRLLDYPFTIFNVLKTDETGMTEMPDFVFTKLEFKDLEELAQYIATDGDEDTLIDGGMDFNRINIGKPNLAFVVS